MQLHIWWIKEMLKIKLNYLERTLLFCRMRWYRKPLMMWICLAPWLPRHSPSVQANVSLIQPSIEVRRPLGVRWTPNNGSERKSSVINYSALEKDFAKKFKHGFFFQFVFFFFDYLLFFRPHNPPKNFLGEDTFSPTVSVSSCIHKYTLIF